MTGINPQDMVSRLNVEGFSHRDTAEALTDPIQDTPMVVTLDELRPYDFNPRATRNPLYDEIKASIRKRGLDSPPAITRRPGQERFMIRSGGNTRLAILRELWGETREERFFRIHCLFHPWTKRGEIEALAGHLAESDLHSELSFIEKAVAVDQLRKFYEELENDSDQPLSQRELARRLKNDGYPVTQPHVCRMQETIDYLLPVIPNTLYGGLGRPQITKLALLRRVSQRVWTAHRANCSGEEEDFALLFQEVLSEFDTGVEGFDFERIQDELSGRMAEALGLHYETFAAELYFFEHHAPKPGQSDPPILEEIEPPVLEEPAPSRSASRKLNEDPVGEGPETGPSPTEDDAIVQALGEAASPGADIEGEALAQEESAPSSERLQALRQRLRGKDSEVQAPKPEHDPARIGPAQVEGLYPNPDSWHIAPELDTPEYLRIHIAQCAQEIAHEAGLRDAVVVLPQGIGFACVPAQTENPQALAVLSLLHVLSVPYLGSVSKGTTIDVSRLTDELGPLLQGRPLAEEKRAPRRRGRLADSKLIALFRLVRLARRLLDIETNEAARANSAGAL